MINEEIKALHRESFKLDYLSDGSRRLEFRDPFTGEPLRPNVVPSSIESHYRLSRGIDYLKSNSDSLEIDIMAAPHSDGDVHDQDEMIQQFASHDAIFFEGLANTQQQRDLIWDVSSGKKTSLTDDEVLQFGEYGVRKLDALSGQDRPVFFADIPNDGDAYEQSLLQWGDIFDELTHKMNNAQGQELENLRLAAGVNLAAATIMREWYMIGSIGSQLADLDSHGGYKSTRPLLLIGRFHGQTLPTKLNALGVKSSLIVPTMTEKGESQPLTVPFDLIKALSHCAVKF